MVENVVRCLGFAIVFILYGHLPLTSSQTNCTFNVPHNSGVEIYKPKDVTKENMVPGDFSFDVYYEAGATVSVPIGRVVFIKCFRDYVLIGDPSVSCRRTASGTAQWRETIPECILATCGWLDLHQDKIEYRFKGQKLGLLASYGFPEGTERVNYQNCACGSKQSSFCLHNGSWSSPSSSCVPETDSCQVKIKGDIKGLIQFRYNNRPFDGYFSERNLPTGSEMLDFTKVDCPEGFIFNGRSVKVCHRGAWIFSEQPCVPQHNPTPTKHADEIGAFGEMKCSYYPYMIWGLVMTVLYAVLVIIMLVVGICKQLRSQREKTIKENATNNERVPLRAIDNFSPYDIPIYSDIIDRSSYVEPVPKARRH